MKLRYLEASLGQCAGRHGRPSCCVPRAAQCRAWPVVYHWNGVAYAGHLAGPFLKLLTRKVRALRAAAEAAAALHAAAAAAVVERSGSGSGSTGSFGTFSIIQWSSQCGEGVAEPTDLDTSCCRPGMNNSICDVNADRIHVIPGPGAPVWEVKPPRISRE